MKYIRTIYETRLYEVEEVKELNGTIWYCSCDNTIQLEEREIVKQADTIEELCDAYVITSKQGRIYDTYGDYGYELKEVLPQAMEECPYEDWNLYGCILVDGIIKQVAIYNRKKGKLELL